MIDEINCITNTILSLTITHIMTMFNEPIVKNKI